ncbi:hypothetical protein [Melissospora conviva]|uniref:hypothetical protein n=1 Tax=Melissospora conviva TaxID=3388432 RepID=UPI003C1D9CC0
MAQVTQSSGKVEMRGRVTERAGAIRACRENQITLLHRVTTPAPHVVRLRWRERSGAVTGD